MIIDDYRLFMIIHKQLILVGTFLLACWHQSCWLICCREIGHDETAQDRAGLHVLMCCAESEGHWQLALDLAKNEDLMSPGHAPESSEKEPLAVFDR